MNKTELKARCADLGIDTEGLDTNAKLEAAIVAKEAELAQVASESTETVTGSEESVTEEAETVTGSKETVTEEAEAAELEAERVAAEEAEAEAARIEAEKETEFYEDDRGRKWKFKSTAPKTLNIDGHPMSQKEILDTEEVISELVYGNCGHLTQIL